MNRNNYSKIFVLSAVIIISFCISACTKQPLTVQYHNLTADLLHSGKQETNPSTLLIGPVRVSSFLGQGPIVKQKSLHSASLLEQHHWAGNLDEMLLQILTQNLISELGSEKIYPYPDNSSVTGLRLAISFFHLEEDENGKALLQSRWQLISNTDQSVVYSTTSTKSNEPENSGYDAIAKALSQSLADLSHDIAEKINQIQHPLQPRQETQR